MGKDLCISRADYLVAWAETFGEGKCDPSQYFKFPFFYLYFLPIKADGTSFYAETDLTVLSVPWDLNNPPVVSNQPVWDPTTLDEANPSTYPKLKL
jgi:hypothetical protein